jgi:hypothetical protein
VKSCLQMICLLRARVNESPGLCFLSKKEHFRSLLKLTDLAKFSLFFLVMKA